MCFCARMSAKIHYRIDFNPKLSWQWNVYRPLETRPTCAFQSFFGWHARIFVTRHETCHNFHSQSESFPIHTSHMWMCVRCARACAFVLDFCLWFMDHRLFCCTYINQDTCVEVGFVHFRHSWLRFFLCCLVLSIRFSVFFLMFAPSNTNRFCPFSFLSICRAFIV